MRTLSCDVAIIGAGSAGLAAREAACEAGAKTLLIERGPGGTTCARTGCMPSKLLIAAAAAAHGVAGAELFGLRVEGRLAVDGPAVMARVRRERDRFVGSVLKSVGRIPSDETLHGTARFLDAGTLACGDDVRIAARAVVIATGSRSGIPESLAPLGDLVLTNETVFELPTLPASLAVIGAGPLGLELAQAFARLGTSVTVLDEGDAVAGLRDPEVARAALELLRREMRIDLGASVEARRVAGGAELAWTGGNGGGRHVFERVLVAAGRPPELGPLDLARTGLALDRHGVPVFDRATLRCGESAIFIAGDANHDRPVLHEASDQGRIAGRNAARCPDVAGEARLVPLGVVYTEPEIATVGPGWPEIADSDLAVGEADLSESGRARVMGRNAGLIRVYADRASGRMLGGAMVGSEAEHLAHLLAWTAQLGLTADEMLALPYYHPTLEESLRTAIRTLCGSLRTRAASRPDAMEYGPGS